MVLLHSKQLCIEITLVHSQYVEAADRTYQSSKSSSLVVISQLAPASKALSLLSKKVSHSPERDSLC